MDQQLQVASRRAELRHRLLRARELCLLGEYEKGVPEFRAVLQDVKRQCAFATPEVRQFLQELQNEYAIMVQYQKTLHDLRACANKVQERRRSRSERRNCAWDLTTAVNKPASAVSSAVRPTSASTSSTTTRSVSSSRWKKGVVQNPPEPMDIDQQGASCGSGSVLNTKLAMDKRLPAWAKKSEPVSRSTATTRAVASRRSSSSSTATNRASGSAKDKENVSKNVVARYGTNYKSTAEAALTRRRGRVSTGGGGNTTTKHKIEMDVPPRKSRTSTGTTHSNDDDSETLIAGRKKYSEVAKDNGWADQELIESIEREIVDRGEPTRFDDIAGLAHTKQLLQEAVMLPQIAPHLFKDGLLKHCGGILMFGPPGTGKTLLAKAVANECGLTFFNVSASTLSSKYRGDSEKLVRILFEMARYYAPAIIFMDEIDAIASARGAANEHEASRRVKTELLVQINGVPSCAETENPAHVMLLAATNLPWELDEAMRRRLTKRVYIPLPEGDARRALFQLNLRRVELSDDLDLEELVAKTSGYSGDDITNVCETAKRMPVKRLYTPDVLSQLSRRLIDGDAFALENQQLIVTRSDFLEALQNVSKSVSREQLVRFREWEHEFGSK